MPFLVMELLRGEELGQRLKRLGRLPPGGGRDVPPAGPRRPSTGPTRHPSSTGISSPRTCSSTQRDDGTPRMKILDFGVAKLLAEGGTAAGITRSLGTPIYMAPEQFRTDTKLTSAVDIYALGMIAYTLLVGDAVLEPGGAQRERRDRVRARGCPRAAGAAGPPGDVAAGGAAAELRWLVRSDHGRRSGGAVPPGERGGAGARAARPRAGQQRAFVLARPRRPGPRRTPRRTRSPRQRPRSARPRSPYPRSARPRSAPAISAPAMMPPVATSIGPMGPEHPSRSPAAPLAATMETSVTSVLREHRAGGAKPSPARRRRGRPRAPGCFGAGTWLLIRAGAQGEPAAAGPSEGPALDAGSASAAATRRAEHDDADGRAAGAGAGQSPPAPSASAPAEPPAPSASAPAIAAAQPAPSASASARAGRACGAAGAAPKATPRPASTERRGLPARPKVPLLEDEIETDVRHAASVRSSPTPRSTPSLLAGCPRTRHVARAGWPPRSRRSGRSPPRRPPRRRTVRPLRSALQPGPHRDGGRPVRGGLQRDRREPGRIEPKPGALFTLAICESRWGHVATPSRTSGVPRAPRAADAGAEAPARRAAQGRQGGARGSWRRSCRSSPLLRREPPLGRW